MRRKKNFFAFKKREREKMKHFKAFSGKEWKQEMAAVQFGGECGAEKIVSVLCFISFDNHTGDLQLPVSFRIAGF